MASKQKSIIRAAIQQQRAALSTNQQSCAAEQVANHCRQLDIFHTAAKIAIYYPTNSELSPLKIKISPEQTLYLPVIQKDKTLRFAEYEPSAEEHPLIPNQYGILEPNQGPHLPAEALNIICLPLTAATCTGDRLGMGGGYYDRTCTHIPKTAENKPILVGLGHHLQLVDTLPTEPHDISLDYFISDQAIITCENILPT